MFPSFSALTGQSNVRVTFRDSLNFNLHMAADWLIRSWILYPPPKIHDNNEEIRKPALKKYLFNIKREDKNDKSNKNGLKSKEVMSSCKIPEIL